MCQCIMGNMQPGTSGVGPFWAHICSSKKTHHDRNMDPLQLYGGVRCTWRGLPAFWRAIAARESHATCPVWNFKVFSRECLWLNQRCDGDGWCVSCITAHPWIINRPQAQPLGGGGALTRSRWRVFAKEMKAEHFARGGIVRGGQASSWEVEQRPAEPPLATGTRVMARSLGYVSCVAQPSKWETYRSEYINKLLLIKSPKG